MSNANKKPVPLYAAPDRKVCPVCGHTSYSPTGIHPQCAMQVSDRIQLARINARKPVVAAVKPVPRHFEKICPRCRVILHVRCLTCKCGYAYPT